MTEIRVLTIRQPYAWAVIFGGKDVENRSRNIAGDYRGPVAISAGQRMFPHWDQDLTLMATFWRHSPEDVTKTEEWYRSTFLRGVIIGVADLVDVHWAVNEGVVEAWPICSRWADGPGEPCFHLVFANPRPLSEPVPFRGGQGLRRLDPATIPGLEAIL